jgi:hypothetical protein
VGDNLHELEGWSSDHRWIKTEVDGSEREPMGSVVLEEWSGSASVLNIQLWEPLCS